MAVSSLNTTRFPTRADSIAERMLDFADHLRANGISLGVADIKLALRGLQFIDILNHKDMRLALKALCSINADQFDRFDDVFNAFWLNRSHKKQRLQQTDKPAQQNRWTNQSAYSDGPSASDTGTQDLPDDDKDGEAASDGEGQLVASLKTNIEKADLRQFMKPEDMARAQKIAEQLAKAMVDRRSRRKKADQNGTQLDLRKIARNSIATGGVPIKLARKSKPERPVHIVSILDVSGSMTIYARVFLSFLKGLISADRKTDAYLFHTNLVRISDALRDPDSFRSINQLSMMAQGFGGGTKIGKNIEQFNAQYAAHSVTGRTIVIILSDGYDTDPPEILAAALKRLKKKGCKLIWLNPLKGWKDYQPIAAGMKAALPHIDLFASATTLNDLAALEPHLEAM